MKRASARWPAGRVLLTAALLCPAYAPPASGVALQHLPDCEQLAERSARAADLYCFDLIPRPDVRGAIGRVELERAPSPFDITVSLDGHQLYDVAITLDGLPTPQSLGAYGAFVAWVTTPVLDPMVKLGEVRNGRTELGRVAFNKFLVIVSAESDAEVEERTGRLVLRGTSPSVRLQRHDMLLLGRRRPEQASGGASDAHGAHHSGSEWVPPPMNPSIPRMMPGLEGLEPSVRPFLPEASESEGYQMARPNEVLELRDGDTIALEAVRVRRVINGREFTMYGFNGQYPGPLIKVRERATVIVRFTNHIDLPTTVHWHGLRLENAFDGVPDITQALVQPGHTFVYRLTFPDPGLYWYHPHHREDIQQDLGLYGNMLVESSDPSYFGPANREEMLILDDLLVADSGLVPFGRERATHALMGRFGNVHLVNGEPDYRLRVRHRSVVRFFVTNVSNTRTYNVSFGSARMKLIGADLGKFEREEWVTHLSIAPAQRYIVDVLFDRLGAVALTNRVQAIDHTVGAFLPEVDTLGVIQVVEPAARPDYGNTFATLRRNDDVAADIERYRHHFGRAPDHELFLTLEVSDLPFPLLRLLNMDRAYFHPAEWSGTMPMMDWIPTGREVSWVLRDAESGRENMDIAWQFRVGDVVKIRLVNDRNTLHAMPHPIHVHGQRFLVLAHNDVPNDNLVWKDTMLLPVGATADILVEVTNPGKWMIHCHIAEHLDAGMMAMFVVKP